MHCLIYTMKHPLLASVFLQLFHENIRALCCIDYRWVTLTIKPSWLTESIPPLESSAEREKSSLWWHNISGSYKGPCCLLSAAQPLPVPARPCNIQSDLLAKWCWVCCICSCADLIITSFFKINTPAEALLTPQKNQHIFFFSFTNAQDSDYVTSDVVGPQ